MSRIRRERTAPEEIVRRAARAMGLRLQRPKRNLPGSPDLANIRLGIAVFVHGCFWHHHRGCRKATIPQRNRAFWLAKFERNRARDRQVARKLRRLGFRVVTIWECDGARLDRLIDRLLRITLQAVSTETRGR